MSAAKGLGVDLLLQAITARLSSERVRCCFRLTPQEGNIRAKLHQLNAVVSEEFDKRGNCLLEVSLSVPEYYRLWR